MIRKARTTPEYDPNLPRLTDKQALAKFSYAARLLIRKGNFFRCLVKPNCWHNPASKEPGTCGRCCTEPDSA